MTTDNESVQPGSKSDEFEWLLGTLVALLGTPILHYLPPQLRE
jgi:hypothetical protein